MSTDPLDDLAAVAEHAYRYRHRPPAPTVVGRALYEAAKNNPALGMQHLVESGQIITWEGD